MAKKNQTIKVKAVIMNTYRHTAGEAINHFGHTCTVSEEGFLICDMDEEMAKIELDAGRFMIVEEQKDLKTPEI